MLSADNGEFASLHDDVEGFHHRVARHTERPAGGIGQKVPLGRAQLAAVSDAPDPDLALIDLIRPLPLFDRAPEVHDRGYRDAAAAIVRWVHRHAARFPAIDPTRKVLPQLDRLTPEEIRTAARGVLAEGWNPVGPSGARVRTW